MSGYQVEEPVPWSDGYIEMLSDPNHFKITPCAVVDYTNSAPPDDLLLPSLASPPEPEQPASRWQRLRAAWRGEA
jgi:hypothetical protein